MAVVIALGIALAAVAFVAAPLFFGVREASTSGMGDRRGCPEMEDLLAERETLYAAIQELDFDYKSGKLSEADHAALRRRYEERAANVLQGIDKLQAGGGTPDAPRKARREKRRG